GLLTLLFERLPAGEPVFSEDEITTMPMRFMAAEIIRERLARMLHDELPYQVTVDVDRYEENERGIGIGATIYVARHGQKGIVIGKGGQQLKQVGQQAREALQRLTNSPVHLDLWVKVHEGWADDERSLAALGYQLTE
ncbi:MAG TPA: GTPase Era, partial [Halothiobacillaceae bacterium]|nr:GTPase Era [Halothiobacillaceae bacterium]